MADGSFSSGLERSISAARRGLAGPAIAKAFGPFLLWAAAFASYWLLGGPALLPPEARAAVGCLFWIVAGVLAVRGLRRYRRPSDDDARAFIDTHVEGRPLGAWVDRPVAADTDGFRLWVAHRERMARRVAEAGRLSFAGLWRQADPFRLRFVAPAVLALAALVAGPSALDRLRSGAFTDIGALFGAHKLTVEAWAAPPAYTGDAPFLLATGVTATTPVGSEITLRADATGQPRLRIERLSGGARTTPFTRTPDGAWEAKVKIEAASRLRVKFWGDRAVYRIDIKPDLAPTVAFVTDPKLGDGDATEFEWKVGDDYGVIRMELVARLAEPPEGAENIEETTPVDLASLEPRDETGRFSQSLVRHRWAGLQVKLRLRVTDAAGQTGESQERDYHLPEKLFFQPMAQSAAEIRASILREYRDYAPVDEADAFAGDAREGGDLSTFAAAGASRLDKAPEGVRQAAMMLDAVTWKAEDYIPDPVIFMGLRHAWSIIATAVTRAEAEEAEEILWQVALRAEHGSLADARAALDAARRALEEALRKGASEEEIRRLMQAYRQAVEDYLAARMAEALRNGNFTENEADGEQDEQALQDDQLERMLDALEDLSETGASDQARQLLSDMSRMLEQFENMQLQMQNGQSPEGGQPEDNTVNRALKRALEEANRQLRSQRDLNDETAEAERRGDTSQQRGQELADQQRQLRERLERQQREFGERGEQGDNGDGSEGTGTRQGSEGRRLRDAIEAQRRAEEALRRGDFEAARRAQQDALGAMTDRASELARAGEPGDDATDSRREGEADPLRALSEGGMGFGDDVNVPDEIERQRARDILDELRRRAGKRNLTREELDYLRRLLDRF